MDMDPNEDPVGDPPPITGSPDEVELKDQQVFVAQLKEMLKKTDHSNVTQEKVDRYASTLTKMSVRAKKNRIKRENAEGGSGSSVDPPVVNEKISLLRKQLEENKAKLAERGKSQKDIKEMVTQLKAQFDDSLQLIHDTSTNFSMHETSRTDYSKDSSSAELYNILVTKEKRIADLSSKVQKLDNTVLDLQENLKEKDCVIDARTKAITLMTESLSKKGKNTQDALDETKEQMRKMQEDFIKLEDEMKSRQFKLLDDLRMKNLEIAELEEQIHELKSKKIEMVDDTSSESLRTEIENLKSISEENKLKAELEIEEKTKRISDLESIIESMKNEAEKNETGNENVNLKKELDELNKSMIKVKAEHKKKLKMLNKKIDSFKKINDSNAHIVKLSDEVEKLKEKIALLEEEKGNFQLLIEELNEKLQKESESENVESKIDSIHFEETIEKHEGEIANLKISQTSLIQQNTELSEKIEALIKEKSELQTKLDQYIQENMDLIDKLEKLSAEKVSSAESIEMVENLTQQEKLELEEYQKNLDTQSGKLKISEEHLEGLPDLNDTVNQLTEETSELLQKIELFTVERREVMEKMEFLKNENNGLVLKLKQIENNRDLLSETYEQLQSEKEQLETENKHLKESMDQKKIEDLNRKLYELEGEYMKLAEEKDELITKLKEKSEILHEKDGMELEMSEAKKKIEQFERKLSENMEEIQTYQQVIEENKEELIQSAAQLNELKAEIEQHKNVISELNATIDNLNRIKESEIGTLETQLQELKRTLNENLLQISDYEKELEENTEETKSLNIQLREINSKNSELQSLIEIKDSQIDELKTQIQEKDEMFHKLSSEMKEKFISLQKRTEVNTESLEDIREPLQKKIEELTTKNNALLEKMKKIAANLKKKNQTCTDLEQQLKFNQEKWESELNEKNAHISNLQQILNSKNENKSLQEELLTSSDSFDTKVPVENEDQNVKLQELQLIIETRENEIINYKERISVLEETLAQIDEKRETLEQKTNELGVQLLEKSQSFEEISKSEDHLEEKLKHLSLCNEELKTKLEETLNENQTFSVENTKLKDIKNKLKQKLTISQERVNELLEIQKKAEVLETELEESAKKLRNLEMDVRKLEMEKLNLEESSKLELEKLDNDWQLQYETISKEKSELHLTNEKLLDKISELMEKTDKLAQLEIKFEETRELNGEIEKLQLILKSKENEIRHISNELQSSKLETESLRNEIEKINQIPVAENVQIQQNQPIFAWFDPNPQSDPFNFVTDEEKTKIEDSEIENLKRIISEKNDEIQRLSNDLELVNQKMNQSFETSSSDILQKIKTLEFMLKNTENERDEVLNQCSELTSEVMKLVYESENQKSILSPDETDQIESQIMTQHSMEISPGKLEELEFTPSKEIIDNIVVPSTEEVCEKKEAYLCHPSNVVETNIESQVLLSDYFKNSENSQKRLQELEFEKTGETFEPCEKKDTYLCSTDPFGENDDGWGWNSEEAQLEEQRNIEFENNPLNITIKELQQKVETLEQECKIKTKEHQELQLKSAKMLKKLKEMKAKNEKLQQSKSGNDMFDLESAIEEELKTQIQGLEKKITELNNELIKEKNERSSLQEKLENLSLHNTKLSETKEIQDVEMVNLKRRAEELQLKLNQFEWESGERQQSSDIQKSTEIKSDLNDDFLQKRIDELNETIRELSLDNEELQALLEEQRTLRLNAEKTKPTLESEFVEIENEKKKLQDELNHAIKQNGELIQSREFLELSLKEKEECIGKFEEEFNKLKTELSEKEVEINTLQKNSNLNIALQEKLREIEILKAEKLQLEEVLSGKQKYFEQIEAELRKLQEEEMLSVSKISELTSRIQNHEFENQEKDTQINELQEKISLLEISVSEKETLESALSSYKEKIALLENTSEKLTKENENLISQIAQLNEQLQSYSVQLQTKDSEWQILVDQRGSDVAESWKLHLETLETEFAQTESKLRKEIDELEEKCNGLSNENNELRKNANTEIRNEVDRVSNLEQQINERQQYVLQLTQILNEKQSQLDDFEQQMVHLQNQIKEQQETIERKDTEINQMHIVIETTQKQFDEERTIVESVVRKLEEKSSSPILFDLENIINELESQLSEDNSVISNINNELLAKTQQIKNYEQKCVEYEEMITNLKLQMEETVSKLENAQKLLQDQEQKGEVVNELSLKLEDKQKELESVETLLENYKRSYDELQAEISESKAKLIEKDEIISNTSYQLQQAQAMKENENENVQNLQFALQQYQMNLNEKENILISLNENLEKNQQLILEKDNTLSSLHEDLEKHQQLLLEKDTELENLRTYLSEIQNFKNQLELTQNELMESKDIEIQKMLQLQTQLEEHNNEIQQLRIEIKAYKIKSEELQQINDETLREKSELEAIIQDQVLKIENLKEELFERSNDYDSLIAEMEIRKQDSRTRASSATTPVQTAPNIEDPDDPDNWVSRSELDITLYMLHQRDVRCEELTVELTQLLEERDTLQLRLSNALREKEEYKRLAAETGKLDNTLSSVENSPSKSSGAISKGKVSEIVLKSSGTELATEADEASIKGVNEDQLEHKLSQLKKVGYKKDKTLLDEQELRRMQQFSIFEQHISEAAKLPPEAAARLVDANYTLSRDVQSPSKVLLNWLWGRSTPKVNDL